MLLKAKIYCQITSLPGRLNFVSYPSPACQIYT